MLYAKRVRIVVIDEIELAVLLLTLTLAEIRRVCV